MKIKTSLILALSLFWIHPAWAKEEPKDCADIPIFEKFIELSACDLERQMEDLLQELTDIKITEFRRRTLKDSTNGRIKAGELSFSGSYEKETIHFRCSRVRIQEYSDSQFEMKIKYCKYKNYILLGEYRYMQFLFPKSIVKKDWMKRKKGLKVIK